MNILGCGQNVDQIVDGVRLLLYIGWDTFVGECGHGSSACVHRLHPDISAQELSIRSALNQSRAFFFFFSRDRNDVRIAKLEWQKARLQRVHVGHTSGRHAFCRECCHRPAEDTKEQEASRETISHLMRVRGSWYGCLPPHTHFHDDEMADTSSLARWQDIQDGISVIDARMELMGPRRRAQ